MGNLNNPTRYAFRTYQVVDDRNPPTFNTLHEVFAAVGGVKLLEVDVIQTNTPTNMEEIDVVITLDGTPYIYDASVIGGLLNNTLYNPIMHQDGIGTVAYEIDMLAYVAGNESTKILSQYGVQSDAPLEGHSITLEVRQTSAIAAGARIRTKATYKVLEIV